MLVTLLPLLLVGLVSLLLLSLATRLSLFSSLSALFFLVSMVFVNLCAFDRAFNFPSGRASEDAPRLFFLRSSMKFDNKCGIQIFFGMIGSGKTTLAASIARKALKRNIRVFSNMPIKGTLKFELSDLGHCDMSSSVILIDEAGIDFDNRGHKTNFSDKDRLVFFKLIRHFHSSIFLFSQSWSDMDIKIRNLATKYWYVKKSRIPYFICAIPVIKSFGINENEKKPDDIYSLPALLIRPFVTSRCFAPLNWKLFDSWDAPDLPVKEFETW